MARIALVVSVIALLLAGYPLVRPNPGESDESANAPGLGEIMTLQQMRHAKLAIAGSLGNWALADYETDELGEGFDDMVKYHPTHKGIKEPLTQLVPAYTKSAVDDLREAVKAKDTEKFNAAFDKLTAGCNGCHQAADFGFNVVTRPTAPPVTNQDFATH
jgi:hypothetical protein